MFIFPLLYICSCFSTASAYFVLHVYGYLQTWWSISIHCVYHFLWSGFLFWKLNKCRFEPWHEIMAHVVLRICLLQTRIGRHPLAPRCLILLSDHSSTVILHVCEQRRLCGKYHNLMSCSNVDFYLDFIAFSPIQMPYLNSCLISVRTW